MKTPEDEKRKVVVGPNFLNSWFVYDYLMARDQMELQELLQYINRHGYDLVSVTQDPDAVYTVFFKRRACG